MKKTTEYILVVCLLLFLLLILFKQVIIGNSVFVSGDALAPQAFKQSIQNMKDQYGFVSYWFPYIFSGMPTLHSFIALSELYFPHKIILLLNSFGLPWIWNFIFHYIFAGFGMYLFLRFLNQNKLSSFFGSSLYMICPYMIAYFVHGHGSQMMTAAYIPWIILFIFKIFNKSTLTNFAILSLLVGLQLQRGHVQIAYYTWMLMGLFILINFVTLFKNSNKTNFLFIIKKYSFIISSLLLGFVFSLNVYLPVMNYTSNSVRGAALGGYGINQATAWSLNFNEFITFLLPYHYGFGGSTYWGYLQFTDFANFLSLLTLLILVTYLSVSHLISSERQLLKNIALHGSHNFQKA